MRKICDTLNDCEWRREAEKVYILFTDIPAREEQPKIMCVGLCVELIRLCQICKIALKSKRPCGEKRFFCPQLIGDG